MTDTDFTPAEASAMHAALEAALNGQRGANPLVGAAVLSVDGRVVTGFHAGAGSPHAEVEALRRARSDGVDLRRSTLLVTLEPCRHRGRTGPCTQAILDAGVPSVVFALPDPHSRAAGGGDALRAAGIRVRSGLLRTLAQDLNSGWLRAQREARPFITAKTAQTLDGYAAADDGTSQWITGVPARARGQALRAAVSAILVGTGTVLADDPRLTARTPGGELLPRQPVAVVLGERDLPPGCRLRAREDLLHFRPDGRERAAFLRRVVADLRARGHEHVLVEGGPGLVGSFVEAGLVDQLMVFTAPLLLGSGRPGVQLRPRGTLTEALPLEPDPASPPELVGRDALTTYTTTVDRHHHEGDRSTMFTGIIQGFGTVEDVTRHPDGSAVLTLRAPGLTEDLPVGGSLAVNGVCLTALPGQDGDFAADVMGETLALTTLGSLVPGDRVNLERALRPTQSLDGHVVQGHVDGTGRLVRRTEHERWVVLRFAVPSTVAPLLAHKGSVAVDGVSLTISGVSAPGTTGPWFEVSLIPATLTNTTLGRLTEGDRVNLEVDVMAKYAQRLAGFAATREEVSA